MLTGLSIHESCVLKCRSTESWHGPSSTVTGSQGDGRSFYIPLPRLCIQLPFFLDNRNGHALRTVDDCSSCTSVAVIEDFDPNSLGNKESFKLIILGSSHHSQGAIVGETWGFSYITSNSCSKSARTNTYVLAYLLVLSSGSPHLYF